MADPSALKMEHNAERARSLQIDRMIEADRRIFAKLKDEPQVLVLGSGDSGKTTFMKQIKILHGPGYAKMERSAYRAQILENIRDSFLATAACLQHSQVQFSDPQLMKCMTAILDFYITQSPDDRDILPANLARDIQDVWGDSGLQRALAETDKSRLQIQDTAGYFLSQACRFADEKSLPTNDDIVRIRSPTLQITESEYKIDNINFHFYDVGGQLKHRKQWVPYFDHVHTVIFVVSLACYDQMLAEDETINRMHDALGLFEEVCNNPLLRKIPVTLFLNKKDLFETKIHISPIGNYFPDFSAKGTQFFDKKFRDKLMVDESSNHQKRNMFTHVTCCTDTSAMGVIIVTVMDSILQRGLESIGI
ncbi:hypothetical protein BSLG_008758 [Batrachochytrium salamandrivorans]|nr:hypothetical protein BSLG_008758 [Batrachochytrium salamandrivorans]